MPLDFVSPIDCTNVRKLKEKGAIITGKTNMDEFGMGSFGRWGYNHTIVRNAINEDYFAGGSSAGSASSVKAF